MKGLVGFFDILGYQSFLENNSASESALKVLQIINDVPKRATESVAEAVSEDPDYKGVAESLTHLVFSDTVVFTLAYPEEASADWIYMAQGYLLYCSAVLTSEMFEMGLPIRGAIHEGEFITKEHCLAGKAVVEAYQLCESLDYASLALSESLGNKIINSQHDGAINNDSEFLFKYLAPLKDGSEKKLVHLNWVKYLGDNELDKFEKDADSYVLSSFWAHQKDCPQTVDRKLHNTAKIMRKMLQNYRLDKAAKGDAVS
jgi:hypothetical protein